MHRPSPPNLPPPPLPLDVASRNAIAPWQRRSALYHVAATMIHLIGTVFVLQWLRDDWTAQWGDQTFADAFFLALDGTLTGAFGIWLLMAFLLFCLALGAVQFAVTAALFRYSAHRATLMVFAWFSILSPPVGTPAGLHALRCLKADGNGPKEPLSADSR
jgi:hypothetical protein